MGSHRRRCRGDLSRRCHTSQRCRSPRDGVRRPSQSPATSRTLHIDAGSQLSRATICRAVTFAPTSDAAPLRADGCASTSTAPCLESLTQSEITARRGISQMHVSRLLSQSLYRLREALAGGGPASTVA
ncbi:hypothetical protein GR927_28065 [Mycolicibacterium sp. 3033]|nr:hypothetical protein [Mycolicibacterium aurantiacum]